MSKKKGYDFSGWATRNNLKCSDGRIIRHNAFVENDGNVVPLVWNHGHNDPSNILGYAVLENRPEGVYTYGTFNDTPAGMQAKELVKHGDITSLSIYANNLKQSGPNVLHGQIREVSLVLSGANPGASIENIIEHSALRSGLGYDTIVDEAIIHFDNSELIHSDYSEGEYFMDPREIYEGLADEEKEFVNELVHSAMEDAYAEGYEDANDADAEYFVDDDGNVYDEDGDYVGNLSDEDDYEDYEDYEDDDEYDYEDYDYDEGDYDMKHSIFENDMYDGNFLSHSDEEAIFADAKAFGSLKDSFLAHTQDYGITDIGYLFPDAKAIQDEPGFIKRRPDDWVKVVLDNVHRTPFARIKMLFADITATEARAKGYIKGTKKAEEVFSLLKRTVTPTTIYKKQKLDRDDIIDITDFSVVTWLKGEMRTMLDEEIARAILFGDGRTALDPDRIDPTHIIPIVADDELYTIQYEVEQEAGEKFAHAIVRSAITAQNDYEGSGNLFMFAPVPTVTQLLLLEDLNGRRIYKDMNDLALAMNVAKVVKVPAAIVPEGTYAVIVDLKDYNVGADKGGAVNLFDDFDIDYNQQKYLIETRCSGAMVKPKSAIHLKAAEDATE